MPVPKKRQVAILNVSVSTLNPFVLILKPGANSARTICPRCDRAGQIYARSRSAKSNLSGTVGVKEDEYVTRQREFSYR